MAERLNVYTTIPREGKADVFVKIGAAWVNRDGSINVALDALPVNGRLHIHKPAEDDDTPAD